jgi:adenine deaminase
MNYDLVLKNINYLDIKSHSFIKGDIAIKDGYIKEVSENLTGTIEKNCTNKYLVPGFIDSHIHLESSIINPVDFAKMVSLHGTTAVVTDPHEIANVCGIDGIKWIVEKTKNLPIDVYIMISSCVPATPFDESAYTLNSKEVEECFNLDKTRILGLAEMMNYPGVINDDPEVLRKIKITKDKNLRVDGHAPGLTGKDFEKYLLAGIESDHECRTLEEATDKLDTAIKNKKDFYIMIREGTAAKNLESLYELINIDKYKEWATFATDDKHPEEIHEDGHIDHIIRKAIKLGVNPIDAYITASYNAAKYFRLNDLGSIEPNKKANLVILSNLEKCTIETVYKEGIELTKDRVFNWEANPVSSSLEQKVRNRINMKPLKKEDIYCKGIPKKVIGLVSKELITTDEGFSIDYNLEKDIIKMVVIEPHNGTMHTGICYLKGLGLTSGAIGTTVSHDSHYCIIAGTNDEDITLVANKIREMQGGKIVVRNGKVLESLPLPIANLMTDEHPMQVIDKMKKMKEYANINNKDVDPFMNLSFVSLAVIGALRLLPGGVFDVANWSFIKERI